MISSREAPLAIADSTAPSYVSAEAPKATCAATHTSARVFRSRS